MSVKFQKMVKNLLKRIESFWVIQIMLCIHIWIGKNEKSGGRLKTLLDVYCVLWRHCTHIYQQNLSIKFQKMVKNLPELMQKF